MILFPSVRVEGRKDVDDMSLKNKESSNNCVHSERGAHGRP